MKLHRSELPHPVLDSLAKGTVIPAHPLALDGQRRLDRRRQRALTRYYVDAGVGGLAVGVHTTQFIIRERGLYREVLQSAMQDQAEWADRELVMIAGLCGDTAQAVREAHMAVELGYHAGLLSLAAVKDHSMDALLDHCKAVAKVIPVIGFYLQSAVGGPQPPSEFWRRFAEIDNVLAIKVAPFHRYRTLDVMRGVVEARAENRVYLYTGNDDHILLDLALPFTFRRDGEDVTVRFRGGLLGHWSVWTQTAVAQYRRVQAEIAGGALSMELLGMDARVTDCNAAFFDVRNNFHGCIAGCHEVLRRQGLLEGTWCLDPNEGLGPGQFDEIDRVYRLHGDLADDAFVRDGLARWLS